MYVQPHPLQCCSCFPKVSLIQKCVYAMLVGHLGASASLVLLDLLSHLTSLLLLLQRNVLRCVRHFQYIGWPDRGVPTSGSALLDLIGQVQRNQEANGSAGPVVVHCRYGPFPSPSLSLSMLAAVLQHYNVCVCLSVCVVYSSGASRTGVYCAVCIAIERVKLDALVDIFHTVKTMRMQRVSMVQTLVSTYTTHVS